MPAPYTDAEQDTLIDQLVSDLAALTTRVDALETAYADLVTADTGLGGDIGGLDTRVAALEDVAFPAVEDNIEVLQEDVRGLAVQKRQENDPQRLAEPRVVLRSAIERVRGKDGKVRSRVVKPR